MINVANKICEEEYCNVIAHFNYEGKKRGFFCYKHKKEGMINITSDRCKTPMCGILVSNEKYDGYCLFCYIHTFPDKPVSRNYKTKEKNNRRFCIGKFPRFYLDN